MLRWKKFNFSNKDIFKWTMFIVLSFLFSLLVVLLNFKKLYYAGGDQSLMINPNILLKISNSTWDENFMYLLGGPSYGLMTYFPLVLFFKLFSFAPIIFREYLYYSLVFFLIFNFSFLYFYKCLFNNNFNSSFVASLFYLFNLFFFVNFLNNPTHLAYICLPVLMLFVEAISKKNIKNLLFYGLLSSLFLPGMFSNLMNGIPVIGFVIFYLFYLFIKNKLYKNFSTFIKWTFGSLLFIFVLNLWWFLPTIKLLLENSIIESSRETITTLFKTTSLTDLYRTLGGWAFNQYYLNFSDKRLDSLYIDNFVFVFTSFTIIIFGFISSFFIKKNKNILFFVLSLVLALFFAKGDLEPWGKIYMFLWKNIPGMFGFREPYTKFTLIYVFSISCLLGYSYYYLSGFFNKHKTVIFYTVLLTIFVNSIPFIIGGFIPSQNNAGLLRSYLVKIPDYLWQFRKDDSFEKMDYRYLSFPEANGGKAYNWENGFNSTRSEIYYFTEKSVFLNDQQRFYKGNELVNEIYKNLEKTVNGSNKEEREEYIKKAKLLCGILNIGKVILENDLDWRWMGDVKSPNESKILFLGLIDNKLIFNEKNYGKFDNNYLEKIPNKILDYWTDGTPVNQTQKTSLSNLLKENLLDKPVISTFKISQDVFTPKIYIPEKIFISPENQTDFFNTFSLENSNQTFSVFFIKDNPENQNLLTYIDNKQLGNPVVEYKKINASKYRLILHKAKGSFPIVFSEASNKLWKLYLIKNISIGKKDSLITDKYKILDNNQNFQSSKEELISMINSGSISSLGNLKSKKIFHYTYKNGSENVEYIENYNIEFISKNYKGVIQNNNLSNGNYFETSLLNKNNFIEIPDKLIANGFANSWLLKTEDLCNQNIYYCQKNDDNTFDLELLIEFSPEKTFVLLKYISAIIFTTGLILLFFKIINKHNEK